MDAISKTRVINKIYNEKFVGELALKLANECLDKCPVDEDSLHKHREFTELLSETGRRFFKEGIRAAVLEIVK